MITQGTSQTTASMRLEWCQSGLYSAWVFEARYFQANARVITITGMTTISISRVAVMIRVRSSMPTCPFGLNRVHVAAAEQQRGRQGKPFQCGKRVCFWSSSGLNRWKERVVAHGCLLARLVAETAGFSQFQTCSRHRGTERLLPGHGRRQADTFPDSGDGPVPRAESFLDEQRFRSLCRKRPRAAKARCMPGREGLPFPPGDQVAVIGRLFVVQQARQEPIYRDAEQRLARRSLDRN